MKGKQVAITGIGIISPLGLDATSTWQGLMTGKSGIAPIQSFDASTFPTKIAAEVKNFTIPKSLAKKSYKYAVSFVAFALAAAEQAMEDAGIKPTESTASRWGAVTGAGMMTAEFSALKKFQENFAANGSLDWPKVGKEAENYYSSSEFGKTVANSGLSLLLQQFQIKGYNAAVHTACASGGQALGLAMQAIRRGEADYMLAGGFDSMINPVGLSSFCLLGALSTDNDKPEKASRPFDLTRNGFVLGEGAAFLILEDAEKARARGAYIYALLAGEGNSLSSYRITDSPPDGDGASQAIEWALKDADVKKESVDYINAHGTSTKMNDLSETNAIKAVFQQHAKKMAISSTKSLTGHLIAAAGALEVAITALSIKHQKVPMTANLEKPDSECNLDYVTEGAREKSIGVAMSNSFGFGGSNSCLVLTHPDFEERPL